MTHSAVLLILDALACFRITRLIVADTITAPLRDRLIGSTRAPGAPAPCPANTFSLPPAHVSPSSSPARGASQSGSR